MPNKLAKHLKTIDSFEGRVAERRLLGEDSEAIAQYVHQMVVNKRTNSHLKLDVNEASLSSLLSVEEYAIYCRLIAAELAKTQRKMLAAKTQATIDDKARAEAKIRHADEKEQQKEQARVRQSLLAKGAVTTREVARRLGRSVADVQKLHETGQLPCDGFVPIQYSRGKPVHLWLPETIIRFMNSSDL